MTKKTLLAAVLMALVVLAPVAVTAQTLSMVSTDNTGATLAYATPEPTVNIQEVQGEPYTVVTFQGSVPSTALGAPNLPVYSKLIEIPLCGQVTVKVSHMRFRQLDNLKYPLMPVQPVPSKSDRTPLPFVIDSALYATDGYYELPPATVEKIGVARDRNLACLRISPLAYNPVTGEMLMVTSMTVTLQYHDADLAATERMHLRYHSPDFSVGHNVLQAYSSRKAVRRDAPLHYLIVSHSSFRGALDSLVEWKKRQGMLVTVAYTGEGGVGTTAADIASYIKGYYTQATDDLPAPTYLLLVGDVQQIPPFSSRCTSPASDHITDLYYTTWTDGDNLPDCYWGRLSARNLAELTPQIEKTLLYEQYAFADDSYLRRAVLIAGEDRGVSGDNAYRYADPAMDYIAAYYVNAAHGYTDVRYYKNNTTFAPDGVTVTGSSQGNAAPAALRTLYNQGCGLVNYSAHGYDNEWSTPNFSTSHVDAMTNVGKPSVMIGNCCLSGKFNTTYSDACLGEALLRKGNNAGAVTYIGGTNSTYWPHDFCWSVGVRNNISATMQPAYAADHLGMYDRLFHTHGEAPSAWHITAGSIVYAGNTAVQEYGNDGYALYYWEIYQLFGDPSLMPWLGTARDMDVQADETISMGAETYAVTAPPHAYVALVQIENNTLVAAAFTDNNGLAVLTLPADFAVGAYRLAVTAQNYKPYFQQVDAVVLDGPYVTVCDIKLTNGDLKPGQITTFDIAITNLGTQLPSVGRINLVSQTPGIIPFQPVAHYGGVEPGDTVRLRGVWPTYVSEDLPDGVKAKFVATVEFGGGTATKRAQYTVVAPSLAVVDPWISPELMGDSTSVITCRLVNQGHDTTDNITVTMPNLFGLMTGDAQPQQVGRLAPGSAVDLAFPVTMVRVLPNTSIPFHLYVTDSCGTRLLQVLSFRAGGSEMEDFETGTLTKFNWMSNSNPWEITSGNPYAGTFCARSKTNQSDRSESRMSISWTSTLPDSITFFYKVSSEQGYDMFHFIMDGNDLITASGEEGWTRASFPVRPGTHMFSFSYVKDRYTVSGSDCAWIDNIKLPFSGQISSFVADTVCQGSEYLFDTLPVPTDQTGQYLYSDTSSGQISFLSLLVVEPPQVAIQMVGHPAVGNCVMLKATGADTYLWNTGDSAACIVVCPQADGEEYSVTGCRAGCCSPASITIQGVAVPNSQLLTLNAQPSIFPNPARDRVTVQAGHMRSVEIVNLVGQTLLRRTVNAPAVTLDLQKLPKGIYFVKVETPDRVATQKLVLQ